MDTDSIKVWVAISPNGRPTEHVSYVNGEAALLRAAEWHKWPIDINTNEKMKALGWTIRPYTLTPVKEETE